MNSFKNILFINPPNNPFTSRGILIEPIDLLGLASWTEQLGYSCTILDMDVHELLAQDLNSHIKNISEISAVVIVFDYHIPLHDAGANAQIKAICDWSRENNIVSILGGKAATFWSEDKLTRFGADIYIAHEMEKTLKEILENSELSHIDGIKYQLNGKLISNSNKNEKDKIDLNTLPIANRKLIDLKPYIDVRTMLSSRGCNLQCTFCHVPGFWGWWRGRSYNLVADEIEILVKDFNAQKILFLDDNAIVNTKRMEMISKEIINRNIKVSMGCLGTIDKYNRYTMELMHKAGFKWIHYGAESGDDKQLATMGKKINYEKIKNTVQETQSIGFRVRTSWIMDMPNLTYEGLIKTEKLILEAASEEIRLHFLTLRLGSILERETIHTETAQFIHNSKQNLNISGLDPLLIEQSTQRILNSLVAKGYSVVKNAEDFKNIHELQKNNPQLKIVSLCPLRYGLGWI